jgi:hypothetical protein
MILLRMSSSSFLLNPYLLLKTKKVTPFPSGAD